MGKFIDLTGKRFGKLIALKKVGIKRNCESIWLCKCDCGNISNVEGANLRRGHTKSCGCSKKEYQSQSLTKIKNANKRLCRIFYEMKDRCLNYKLKYYKNYGGRGIKICNEWLDKKNGRINFYNWAMQNGYTDNLTLDRIDNNGNYEPNNCRWVTRKEQQNNRRNNRYITYKGETYIMKQWSEIFNIKYSTIKTRINDGLPEELCFYPGKITRKIRKEYEDEKNKARELF